MSAHRSHKPVHRDHKSAHRRHKPVHRDHKSAHRSHKPVHRDHKLVHRRHKPVHRDHKSGSTGTTGSSEPTVDDQATMSQDQETTQRSSPCQPVRIGDATGEEIFSELSSTPTYGSPSQHTKEVINTDKKALVEPNFRSPSTKLGQNNNCDGITTLGNTLENIEPHLRAPSTRYGQQKPTCKSPPDPSVA